MDRAERARTRKKHHENHHEDSRRHRTHVRGAAARTCGHGVRRQPRLRRARGHRGPTAPARPGHRGCPSPDQCRQQHTSVSHNRLGPWLGLIGNSLNGSLNNSLNNVNISLNGARVSALNGLLSPPFTVLSGNTIVVSFTTIDSDNSSRVTQSETTTITTNGGAPGQQG